MVEEWLDDADTLPTGEHKATYLFEQCFYPWVERFAPGQSKNWSLKRFSQEMTRLAKAGDERIEARMLAKSNSYVVQRPAEAGKLRRADDFRRKIKLVTSSPSLPLVPPL